MPKYLSEEEFDKLFVEGVVKPIPAKKKQEPVASSDTQKLSRIAESVERAIIAQVTALQTLAQQQAVPQPIQIVQKEPARRRCTYTLTVTERDEEGQITQVRIVEDE